MTEKNYWEYSYSDISFLSYIHTCAGRIDIFQLSSGISHVLDEEIQFTCPYLLHDDPDHEYTYIIYMCMCVHGEEWGVGRRGQTKYQTRGDRVRCTTRLLCYMHATSSVTPCRVKCNKERCKRVRAIPSQRAYHHRRYGSVRVDLPWQYQSVFRRRTNLAVSDRASEPVQSLSLPLRGSSRQIRLVNESLATFGATSK